MRKIIFILIIIIIDILLTIYNEYILRVLKYTCSSRDIQLGFACATMNPFQVFFKLIMYVFPVPLLFFAYFCVRFFLNRKSEKSEKYKKKIINTLLIFFILVLFYLLFRIMSNLSFKSIDCCGNIV